MNSQQVVLITGASSGIGYATALAFAKAGVNVVAVARRAARLAELEKAVEKLPTPHSEVLSVIADVQNAEEMRRTVEQAVNRFGRLDILIANAGLGQRGSLVEAEWADLEAVMRTNMDGVLHSIRAAVPAMRQSGGGHIVIVSSVTYNLVSPYAAVYAASKAFVSSLAASLRLELEADHIGVTDMLVGRTNTEFNEKRRGQGQRTAGGVPTMSADQVAAAIVKATRQHKKRVILRPFDRLLVWANGLVPGIMGRIARRQYR